MQPHSESDDRHAESAMGTPFRDPLVVGYHYGYSDHVVCIDGQTLEDSLVEEDI